MPTIELLNPSTLPTPTGYSQLVKLTRFVTDLSHIGAFRRVGDQFLDKDHLPTSTLVQVTRLLFAPGFMIEIEAMAAR